jgi:carbon monoxide dehydrogenase subunit G
MLLQIEKTANLEREAEVVWTFLQDPIRVAACLPNAHDFRRAGEPNRFVATLVERVGPFKVQVPLTIDVTQEPELRRVSANVAGDDRSGQAKVRGDVRAQVQQAASGSILVVDSKVEVLGRLATLGAMPMRRRGDQVFEVFLRNIEAVLSGKS